jgi:hypothetical protein
MIRVLGLGIVVTIYFDRNTAHSNCGEIWMGKSKVVQEKEELVMMLDVAADAAHLYTHWDGKGEPLAWFEHPTYHPMNRKEGE